LREIAQLPDGEQDAAAGALLDYMKHRRDIELTQEQGAEVRRRVADTGRRLISADEARARISRFGSSTKP
jgi:hypothetical protein